MRLGLLGPLQVVHEARTFTVTAAKQRVVLATLLVRARQVVSFDQLADLVWDGSQPTSARTTLRSHVRGLRHALGAVAGARLVTHDPGYLMDVADDEVDILRFGTLLTAGDRALRSGSWQQAQDTLDEARKLWRGDALCDIPSETLRGGVVPHLEEARLQAIQGYAEACLHLGLHAALLPELRALVGQNPLRERFHAQLMLALYRCGRQAEALSCYQQARAILVEELGVEPGLELRDLHQRMLAEDPDLAAQPPADHAERTAHTRPLPVVPPQANRANDGGPRLNGANGHGPQTVPRQMPAAARHFVGRTGELKALWRLLEDDDAANAMTIVVISGTAGVGKTALSVHWAHQAAQAFPDGQVYVNLRGFDPSGVPVTPSEAIRRILGALAVDTDRIPADLDAQAGLYRSLTDGKRMLIVLDNARDDAQVRHLLPGSPGCLVIVTSRSQLSGLAAAQGAQLLTLDALPEPEAVVLLTARLGCERVAAATEAVVAVCRSCAGLPLALAISAAHAAANPGLPLTALAAELRPAQHRLDVLNAGDAAVNIRAAFSWSYQNLSEPAMRMFRLLGLHPGPDISAPAAASLAGIPPHDAWAALRELVRASMISEHIPGRYGCHDLLRAYAAEQAHATDTSTDLSAATHRMLDYYLYAAHAADVLAHPRQWGITLSPPTGDLSAEVFSTKDQALAWTRAERAVLLKVIEQAAHSGFDAHAWQLPVILWRLFEADGLWRELVVTQRTALAAAQRRGDQGGQATTHHYLGRACALLGDYTEAQAHLRQALEIFGRLGDTLGQAHTQTALGWMLARLGQNGESLDNAREVVKLTGAAADEPVRRDLNGSAPQRSQPRHGDRTGARACPQ